MWWYLDVEDRVVLNLDLLQTKSMSDPSQTSLLRELVLVSHLLLGCP